MIEDSGFGLVVAGIMFLVSKKWKWENWRKCNKDRCGVALVKITGSSWNRKHLTQAF